MVYHIAAKFDRSNTKKVVKFYICRTIINLFEKSYLIDVCVASHLETKLNKQYCFSLVMHKAIRCARESNVYIARMCLINTKIVINQFLARSGNNFLEGFDV